MTSTQPTNRLRQLGYDKIESHTGCIPQQLTWTLLPQELGHCTWSSQQENGSGASHRDELK